jgi:hypothetical protein
MCGVLYLSFRIAPWVPLPLPLGPKNKMFIPLLLSSSREWLHRINENANRTAISKGHFTNLKAILLETIVGCRSFLLDAADKTASLILSG